MSTQNTYSHVHPIQTLRLYMLILITHTPRTSPIILLGKMRRRNPMHTRSTPETLLHLNPPPQPTILIHKPAQPRPRILELARRKRPGLDIADELEEVRTTGDLN